MARMPVPTFPSPTEAVREEGQLVSRDGTRLHWQRYAPARPRATVAVLPGGGDHGGRYPALTRALVAAGFEVALLDFRGHGRSEGRRWHVDAFSEYHDDLDAFVAAVRERAGDRKLFVAAHSMGGLIAAGWGLLPGRRADGFVFSSPWLRPAVDPPRLKVALGRVAGRLVPWLPFATGLKLEELTSDPEMQRWTDQDPLYGRKTTPRWFEEAARAQAEVRARAAEFKAPLLVLAAGADTVADTRASRRFVEAVQSRYKELLLYPGLRHELFNEQERHRPVADAVAWLRARCG